MPQHLSNSFTRKQRRQRIVGGVAACTYELVNSCCFTLSREYISFPAVTVQPARFIDYGLQSSGTRWLLFYLILILEALGLGFGMMFLFLALFVECEGVVEQFALHISVQILKILNCSYMLHHTLVLLLSSFRIFFIYKIAFN